MLKLNAFQLKLLAIIGMITSHMVIAWWDVIPTWLRLPMYAAGGLDNRSIDRGCLVLRRGSGNPVVSMD